MPRNPAMPAFVAPQVPVLSPEPPSGSGWIHEVKHDGFRTLIRIDRGQVRALTRGGHDWTDRYAPVVEACRKLACRSALIDGEIIVQDKNGLSDFAALRAAIEWLELERQRSPYTFPWAIEATRFTIARLVLEHVNDLRDPERVKQEVLLCITAAKPDRRRRRI